MNRRSTTFASIASFSNFPPETFEAVARVVRAELRREGVEAFLVTPNRLKAIEQCGERRRDFDLLDDLAALLAALLRALHSNVTGLALDLRSRAARVVNDYLQVFFRWTA